MNETLGRNIVSFRKKLNMTQAQLAEEMCVTYQTISNWERGVSFPDVDAIGKLCEIFCVSSDELFGLNTQKSVKKQVSTRKKISSVAYYTEKAKSAKVLNTLTIIMLVSFVLNKIASVISLGVFGAILYLISAPIYLLSFLGVVVFLFIAKVYSNKKIFIVLYFIFALSYVVLTMVGVKSYVNTIYEYIDSGKYNVSLKTFFFSNKTGNAIITVANICYYVSSVLIYFVFKDKPPEDLNVKFIFAYFTCIAADLFFSFVLKYPLASVFILSLALLVYIKKDKTTEIPYFTEVDALQIEKENFLKAKYVQELMPSSMSGIADKNRFIEEVERDYQLERKKIKIRISDIFSGGKLTAILLFLVLIIISLPAITDLFKILDIVVFLGALPLVFYCLIFVCKRGGDNKKLNILFLLIQVLSLVIQNFIFFENLSLTFLNFAYMIVAVILQFISVGYFVLFYKRDYDVSLWRKLLLVTINFILTFVLMIIALTNEDIKLGMLYIVLVVNILTALIASFTCEDRFG